ncbi:MAG: gamma-butyrobetaine hydroxylase-like domain-containing protein [Rhodospirillales bacterium]
MSTFGSRHTPVEIKLIRDEKRVEIAYDNGVTHSLPAELLRVESPSAEVQGHVPSEKKTIPGRAHVGIMGIEPVGNYAIRIMFDDLHDTGIFSWDYLYHMGENQDQMMQDYLNALEAQGLSREPERRGR